MNTVENALIIPIFAMIIVMLILFNISLHNKIIERSKEYRREYMVDFNDETKQPEEMLRIAWAFDKLKRKE